MLAQSEHRLLRTPLFDLHRELGARFAPFAGYDMPLQYREGILKEHTHTRTAAGLFDVSHMGQVVIRPRDGNIGAAQRALERIVPGDIVGLNPGQQRYTLFTTPTGGILDDLMVAHCGDHLLLIVNAARKAVDLEHLQANLGVDCYVELLEGHALLALQGPASEDILQRLLPEVSKLRFMQVWTGRFAGQLCTVSRSGYTGEDGFEIGLTAAAARSLASQLLSAKEVAPVGLGARDSLRLEASLCLYGADIDETTMPLEAGLGWVVARSRRSGGARQGGFPGANQVLAEFANPPAQRRVGLQPVDRTILRAETELFLTESAADRIGRVTSGGFGPSVNRPVAMGYIRSAHAEVNSTLFAEVRGRRVAIKVVALPFVAHRYKH
jgi:glycine cleavage system T protein (aminomethyltransferase)